MPHHYDVVWILQQAQAKHKAMSVLKHRQHNQYNNLLTNSIKSTKKIKNKKLCPSFDIYWKFAVIPSHSMLMYNKF